jgi:hypothetical protein
MRALLKAAVIYVISLGAWIGALHIGVVQHWLLTNVPWVAQQGIIQNTGLVTIPLAVAAWWHLTCHVPYCWRKADHPVAHTAVKVCNHHHTVQHHEQVYHKETERHPDRLHHGQSHDLTPPTRQS